MFRASEWKISDIYCSLKNIILTILITVFVEKVLRIQPNVKQLFLVVRANDANSAIQRVHDEVTTIWDGQLFLSGETIGLIFSHCSFH